MKGTTPLALERTSRYSLLHRVCEPPGNSSQLDATPTTSAPPPQVFLLDDRLCYADGPGAAPDARYLPLDRVPVRPLPRGYGPRAGVTLLDARQAPRRARADVGGAFSVQCGRHTHLLAAASAEDAQARPPCERATVPSGTSAARGACMGCVGALTGARAARRRGCATSPRRACTACSTPAAGSPWTCRARQPSRAAALTLAQTLNPTLILALRPTARPCRRTRPPAAPAAAAWLGAAACCTSCRTRLPEQGVRRRRGTGCCIPCQTTPAGSGSARHMSTTWTCAARCERTGPPMRRARPAGRAGGRRSARPTPRTMCTSSPASARCAARQAGSACPAAGPPFAPVTAAPTLQGRGAGRCLMQVQPRAIADSGGRCGPFEVTQSHDARRAQRRARACASSCWARAAGAARARCAWSRRARGTRPSRAARATSSRRGRGGPPVARHAGVQHSRAAGGGASRHAPARGSVQGGRPEAGLACWAAAQTLRSSVGSRLSIVRAGTVRSRGRALQPGFTAAT